MGVKTTKSTSGTTAEPGVAVVSDRQPRSARRESRKTRYTNQVLREAFIGLLKEIPLEKITVTRICELADVSRGTFYLHYRDPYDVLERMEGEVLSELERQYHTQIASSTGDYSMDSSFWLEILKMLLASKDLMQLFFAHSNNSFMTKCLAINRVYADSLCRQTFPSLTDREREYMHAFYENGSASVIGQWVRGGFAEPPEQIAELLTAFNLKC